MLERKCTLCGAVKSLEDFVRSVRRPLGRGSWCRPCDNKRSNAYHTGPGKAKSRIQSRRRRERNPRYFSEHAQAYRARHPKRQKPKGNPKEAARQKLRQAVYDGRIAKPTICEGCGKQPVRPLHGHHSDYSKPFAVQWLCPRCHGLAHRLSEATANG